MSKQKSKYTKKYKGRDLLFIIMASMPEKKMRSLGNTSTHIIQQKPKELSIIEYQIQCIKKTFPLSKICVITAFDSKKVIRLLPSDVDYIEYEFNDTTNQANGLSTAINKFEHKNLAIVNNSHVFTKSIFEDLSYDQSFVIANTKHKADSNTGCVLNNGIIQYIFYDLEYKIYDFVFLNKIDSIILKNILNRINCKHMYMFEIINEMLSVGCKILYKSIGKESILIYNNPNKLRSIRRICSANK